MDLRRTKSKYTPEQRLAIIEEYEKGALSGKEIAEKYGIKYPSQILNWRKRLLKKQYNLCKSGKMRTFASEIMPQLAEEEFMKKQTPEELCRVRQNHFGAI